MKKKAFLIFFLIGNLKIIFSQKDSLSKPNYTEWNTLYESKIKSNLEKDTSIDNHFNYFKKDLNGNNTLPSQEIIAEFIAPQELGLNFYRSPYSNHQITQNDIRFYTTKKPYTRVFGLAGQRQEQLLSILHTNNIGNFNYSVFFSRYKNKGFYKRQLGTCDNFLSTLHYKTKNSKYNISVWILNNQLKHEENGGIINQNDFDSLFRENKELLSVQLAEAKRINRQFQAGLTQFFTLLPEKDSSAHFKLFHRSYFKKVSYLYMDEKPNPAYYESIFLDSALTRDSTILQSMSNQTGFSGSLGKMNNLHFRLSYRNEIGNEKQFGTKINSENTKEYISQRDTAYINHFTELIGDLQMKNSKLRLTSEYALSGFYKGNYKLQLDVLLINLVKNSGLQLNYTQEKRNADLFFMNYSSNHFRWNNNFQTLNTYQLNGKILIASGRCWVENYSRVTQNMIWFYTPDFPLQNSNSVFINRFGGGGKLKWKKINLNGSAYYQYTNASEIISLPKLHFHSQLFFENSSDRKDSKIQIGVQLNYYSGFESNAYSPGTNMYYVAGRKTCGNYPFVDFFINAEIQPVKFFILIDHLNQGFSGSNYFLTPNLPMPDRAIKFGFTWLFWD